MFVRTKKQGAREYYYLVENTREGKKVKQKVLRYLGTTRPTPGALLQIINELKK